MDKRFDCVVVGSCVVDVLARPVPLSQPIGADKDSFLARWDEISRVVHDIVVQEFNGSISAEHGVGQMKVDEILRYKPAEAIDMMTAIKRALDPLNIMNPGKVIRLV